MEEFLKLQRVELLQKGAQEQDSYWPGICHQQHSENNTSFLEDQEEDDPEEADLAFITSILESFSKPKSMPAMHTTKTERNLDDQAYAEFPPEGTLPQEGTKRGVTPPKFNYNSTIKMPAPEKFSCFPAVEEEGAGEFLDKSDTEEENSTKETSFETTTTISNIT
jgi:hypothetical protein